MSGVGDYWIIDQMARSLDLDLLGSKKRISYMNQFVQSFYMSMGEPDLDAMDGYRGFTQGRQELGGTWNGFIAHLGRLRGALVSKFGDEPFVVRAFPQYTDPTETTKGITHPYIDGCRATLFLFPSGVIWGKTDTMEFLFRTAQNTVNFQAYLDVAKDWENVRNMVKGLGYAYAINGIIYGKDISAPDHEFYNVEGGFVVTHLERIRDHVILDENKALEFCERYGVTHISMLDNCVPELMIYEYTEDGDLNMYVDPSIYDSPHFKKDKAVIREVWEGLCNNAFTKGHFDTLFDKFSTVFRADLDKREILEKSLSTGKKVDIDWFIPWVLEKYPAHLKGLTASEVYDKLETRFTWSAWEQNFGREFLESKIQQWLDTHDLDQLENRPEPIHYIGDDHVKVGTLGTPKWFKEE